MWQSVEILNVLNTVTLNKIFWETESFFKKLEYRFLAESANIENASFPYKNPLSETNVKTNRIVSTKWTCYKERSLPVTTLFFWKFCFSLRTSYKELFWCTNYPTVHIHTFRKHWSFIWGWFSPVSILKNLVETDALLNWLSLLIYFLLQRINTDLSSLSKMKLNRIRNNP